MTDTIETAIKKCAKNVSYKAEATKLRSENAKLKSDNERLMKVIGNSKRGLCSKCGQKDEFSKLLVCENCVKKHYKDKIASLEKEKTETAKAFALDHKKHVERILELEMQLANTLHYKQFCDSVWDEARLMRRIIDQEKQLADKELIERAVKEEVKLIIADKDRQIEELKTDNKALYLGQLSELVSMKSSIRAVMKKVVDGTNRHEILSDLKRIVGDKD